MSDWLHAVGATLADLKRCLMSRMIWVCCSVIALAITLSNRTMPGLLSVVVSLTGYGFAFVMANLVLANHDRLQLAFVRPMKAAVAFWRLGSVLIAGIAIYLSILTLMLWADWDWLTYVALGAPKALFYAGLGVIPATRLREYSELTAVEWVRYSSLGALPIFVLNLVEQWLQSGLWELTGQPLPHHLLTLGFAICSGAIF